MGLGLEADAIVLMGLWALLKALEAQLGSLVVPAEPLVGLARPLSGRLLARWYDQPLEPLQLVQ